MTTIALFLTVVALMTRLLLMSKGTAIRGRELTWMGILQVLLAIVLLRGCGALIVLPILIFAINAVWFLLERLLERKGGDQQFRYLVVRLGSLVTFGALFTVMGSPAYHLAFRGWVGAMPGLQSWCSPLAGLAKVDWHRALIVALGLLLCIGEANSIIRLFVLHFQLMPPEAAPSEPGRGRIIGALERAILYCLILMSQFSAIGFILAAKAMARFKDLENRDFAEYFLAGTLLSCAIAGSIAFGVAGAIAK